MLALNVGSVFAAAPFVIGLLRSGVRLVAGGQASIPGTSPSPRVRVTEGFALLAVTLAIGLPTLAIVSPIVEGPWPAVVTSGILLAVLVTMGLRFGQARGAYTSGVAHLAIQVAHRASQRDEVAGAIGLERGEKETSKEAKNPTLDNDTPAADAPLLALLDGIDYQPVAIPSGSAADGATLAELDLRCRSGATVVAISRGSGTTTLPTGHEVLVAEDVLALSGSLDSIARAREILTTVLPLTE